MRGKTFIGKCASMHDSFRTERVAHSSDIERQRNPLDIGASDLETKRMLPMAGALVNIYGYWIRKNGG
jgi:hypothetical protein